MFDTNVEYARQDIQRIVGGELQTYLPQKNGIVLAGCFNLELNPEAPSEIQAGNLPKVEKKAELLSLQPETVFPVFLKERAKDRSYRFAGYFRCVDSSTDEGKIAQAENKSGRHGRISRLLFLQQVEMEK